MVIWKKVLKDQVRQTIEVPKGAEFLSAREQHNTVCVWYKFDDKERGDVSGSAYLHSLESREIIILTTGMSSDVPVGRFLGTCSLNCGSYILHVFEGYKESYHEEWNDLDLEI